MVPFPRGWGTEPSGMNRVGSVPRQGCLGQRDLGEPVAARACPAKVKPKSDPSPAGTTNHSSLLSRQREEFGKPAGDPSTCAHILNVSGKPSHSSSKLRLLRADIR